nr:hypothetical protein CFP56_11845 [Quercus suber]
MLKFTDQEPFLSLTAVVAALLVLVVTAIGPFVQQIISFDYKALDVPRAALEAVFAANGTTFNVESTCINANCTWESYYTLAVKSECVDLSDRIQITSPCGPASDHSFTCADYCSSRTSESDNEIPFTAMLSSVANFSMFSEDMCGKSSTESGANGSTSFVTGMQSPSFSDKGGMLLDYILWLGDISRDSYQNVTFLAIATECSLRLVGQQMSASSIGGHFTETPLGMPLENNTELAVRRSSWNILFDDTSENPDAPLITLMDGDQPTLEYQIGDELLLYLSTSSKEVFLYNAYDPQTVIASVWPIIPITDVELYTKKFNATTSQALLDIVTVPMEKVARAMMTKLRGSVGPSNETVWRTDDQNFTKLADGPLPKLSATAPAMSDMLVYHIRWQWISLPVSLVVLVGLLVLLTAFDILRHDLPIWGTGLLDGVVHGVDDETRRRLLACDNREAIGAMFRSTKMQILSGSNTLVPVDQASEVPGTRSGPYEAIPLRMMGRNDAPALRAGSWITNESLIEPSARQSVDNP